MFKEKSKNYVMLWCVCVALMSISIICWIYAMANPVQMYDAGVLGVWQRAKHAVLGTNYAVFDGKTGYAVILALILYTIVGIRNKNTIVQIGDENKFDVPAVVLHILNILFLTSVCCLVSSATIFGLSSIQFITIGIIVTLLGMRSISGFIWILCTICMIFSINNFNKWPMAIPYAICGYVSIIMQIFTIKIFQFDIEQLKHDFLGGKEVLRNVVVEDMKKSIDSSKKVIGQIAKKRSNTNNVSEIKMIEKNNQK